MFKIISESAVAAGVRRIEAVTGEAARIYLEEQAAFGREAADKIKVSLPELSARVEALVGERKKLERELSEAKKALAMGGGAGGGASSEATDSRDIEGVNYIGRVLDGVAPKDLRGLIDQTKKQAGSAVVAFIGVNDGKAALAVGVTDDLKDRLSAVDLVKAGTQAVGGKGGGGRPDMAQAGGPDGAKAAEAVEAIAALIASTIG